MNRRHGSLSLTTLPNRLAIALIPVVVFSAFDLIAQDLEFTIAPFGYWSAVASSADGDVLAAYEYNFSGRTYISTNWGAIWTEAHSFRPGVKPIASDLVLTPDASTLVAIAGFAYTSHDLGITWQTNSLPGQGVYKVVISDDGTKWVCTTSGNQTPYSASPGGIYVSEDSGASWQLAGAPITNWTSVAMSGDGARLAAVYGSNQVYTSTDRGITWTNTMPAGPTNSFSLVVSSKDGNKSVAIGNGIICVSTNGGATWSNVGTPPAYAPLSVAASADATTIALVSGGNQISTSTNSGSSWEQRVPKVAGNPYQPPNPKIALSTDGKRLLEATIPGLVFTSPLPPAVLSVSLLNYPPSQITWAISWPSNQIGFVLESTPTLFPAPRWTAVTNNFDPPVTLSNLNYPGGYRHIIVVTNAIGAPSAFYRLHKP